MKTKIYYMYQISCQLLQKIIFSSLLLVFVLLGISNFLFPQKTIELDLSQKTSGQKSVVGFLHFNDLKALENDIVELKPVYWRIGSSMAEKSKRVEQIKILKGYNIKPILVITDFFYHKSTQWKKPYLDRNNLLNLVEELYKENGNTVVYDLWNEPDIEVFFEGSRQNFFETFKLIHDKIRSLPGGENAIIMGPSTSWFVQDFFEDFLNYCNKNNIRLDLLNWHQNYGIDDAINMGKTIKHVRENLIQKYPNLKIKDIIIPEFAGPEDYFKPLTSLAYVAVLDKEGVAGCKTCGDAPSYQNENTCWNNSIDGLLTPQGKPRSVWWVYKYYAESLSNRLSTKVDSDRTVAISYMSQDKNSANILFGNLGKITSSIQINLKAVKKSSLFSRSTKVNYTLFKVPNTEQKELTLPIKVKSGSVNLKNDNANIKLNSIDTESVYLLKINK
ncbi:GH39 family glycosyl hydrolase [Chryseobacterium sp. FH1]|uniref:GH39 family glycosyl hydrolase n=1 Tax=Chryseobacterium sp. FH1 TaxID=1233951 RepID=UPI0004E3191D|nr:hypothetical protein [Chryseobacterium sp. FH1]KFC20007.1 hypothetical protein IO90_12390 [Chryseobacterium sp. FH1]